MTAPHWKKLSDLFEGALDVAPAERPAWLDANCDDPELRRDIESMLAAHARRDGVLERPLVYDAGMRERLERGLEGRYVIEREIGRGGMATVYLARELKHERHVVIKMLKPEIAEAVGAHRFLAEVRITARLSHPHILTFIDSGEVDEGRERSGRETSQENDSSLVPRPSSLDSRPSRLLYYVMPYVGGETLRERLRLGGVIEPRVALVLLRDIADALAYAHASGIIHRDIKPENVLCVGGHAYLIDFGIAKLPQTSGERWTAEHAAIGTVGYMAPEQASGLPVTERADVYAWGVVAREMLTGAGPMDIALGLATLPAAIPAAAAGVISRAVDADPARRPASAELLQAMDAAVGHTPAGDRDQGGLVRRRLTALAAVALFGAAGLIGWQGLRPEKAGSAGTENPSLGPVAVSVLRNETGDSALSTVGRLAGDWITQGLQEAGVLPVVPWPYALQASEAAESEDDRVGAIRRETGARTVVTGAYYLLGDRLRFQVELTDAGGALIGAPAPVEASRDSVDDALRELREHVMSALAIRANERLAPLPGLIERPPRFAAYQAFDRGLQLHLDQQYARSAREFESAFTLDTTFGVALVYAALSYHSGLEYARADSTLRRIGASAESLSEYHELLRRYIEAQLTGAASQALVTARRAAAIAPNSRAPYNLAYSALQLNRPREALAALQSVDPDRGAMRGWSSYWTQLTHAHHLLGQHDLERAAALELRRRFPTRQVALSLELRALAAQGRTTAIDSVLDAAAGLSPDDYWSQGGAMLIVGEELAAHGHAAAAPRYFERAITWLANQLARNPNHEDHRYWMGNALYDLGRWAEAEPYYTSLVRDSPGHLAYRGRSALVAARLGRRDAERRLGQPTPYDRTGPAVFRARIAAIRGDTAGAVALLSEALRHGIEGFAWLHGVAVADFQPIAADPGFQRVMQGDEVR